MVTTKFLFVLPLTLICFAQQQGQQSAGSNNQNQNQQQRQQQQTKPAPLFGGQLGIKSSDRSKESATLGFNGIDPSGKVDAKMLATTAGPADEAKVKALASVRPTAEQLDAFLKEGELRKK